MISVYANSLFELANEENLLDIFYQHFLFIEELYKEEKIKEFFNNRFVDIKKKEEMVKKYFEEFNIYFKNFLFILASSDHFQLIEEIAEEFKLLYYKEKNIEKGIIYGVSIDKKSLLAIEETFSKKLNKKVELIFKKDEELIAGYRIEIGSKLYDTSYKTKLEKLQKSLKKEA